MCSSPFKNKIFFPGHSCQIYLIKNEHGKTSHPMTLSKTIQPFADDMNSNNIVYRCLA